MTIFSSLNNKVLGLFALLVLVSSQDWQYEKRYAAGSGSQENRIKGPDNKVNGLDNNVNGANNEVLGNVNRLVGDTNNIKGNGNKITGKRNSVGNSRSPSSSYSITVKSMTENAPTYTSSSQKALSYSKPK